jgi:hypothetical protein
MAVISKVKLPTKGKVRYNTTKNHLNVNQNGEIAHQK